MRNLFVATVLAGMAVSPLALAHIELQSPTARYVQNDSGLKTGPCGSGTPTGVVTPLVAGQTLTVRWKESVSHSGHYRIALSAHESDFVEPTSLAIPTMLPPWDLADGIPDKTGTQIYSQDVRIPSTSCTGCVLQLLQVMGAGADGTNSGPFSGVYHACADVTISAANADAGTVADAATSVDLKLPSESPGDATGNSPDMPTGAGGISTGAGGVTGSGGVTGTGGMAAGENGGSASSGGAGATGSGGASGAGGSISNMTGGTAANGGSSGKGGTISTSGDSTGGRTGAGGAPGRGGSTSVTSGGSSGCQMGSHGSATWPVLAVIAALLFVSRRRRTRFGRPTNGAMRSPSWTSSSCATVAIPIKPRPASTPRIARFR